MDYINKQIVNERGSVQVVEGTLTDGSKVYDVQFRVDGVLVTFDCDGPEQADRLMIEMDKALGMKAVVVDSEKIKDRMRVEDEVDGRKLLIKDNPNLIVTADNTPEISIHNVEGVFLESPHVNQDRVFGPTIWRGLNVIQSVKKDGGTEIRRVKVTLFSDDKNKIKMERGHIGTAIQRMSKLQVEINRKEGDEGPPSDSRLPEIDRKDVELRNRLDEEQEPTVDECPKCSEELRIVEDYNGSSEMEGVDSLVCPVCEYNRPVQGS